MQNQNFSTHCSSCVSVDNNLSEELSVIFTGPKIIFIIISTFTVYQFYLKNNVMSNCIETGTDIAVKYL